MIKLYEHIGHLVTFKIEEVVERNASIIFLTIQPLLNSVVTLYVLYAALKMLKGEGGDGALIELIKKLLIMLFFINMATPAGSLFTALSDTIVSGVDELPLIFGASETLEVSLDNLIDKFSIFADKAFEEGDSYLNITLTFQLVLMAIPFLIFTISVFMIVMILKVTVFLLIMIAPLFIIFCGFDKTRNYFWGWLNYVFGAIISLIIIGILIALILSIFGVMANDQLTFRPTESWPLTSWLTGDSVKTIPWPGVIVFIITNGVALFLALKASSIGSTLFGTGNSDGLQTVMNMFRPVGKGALGVGKGALGVGKGTYKLGKWGINKMKESAIKNNN